MRGARRGSGLVAFALLFIPVAVVPAIAQTGQYPPGRAELEVSSSSVAPGGSLTVSGDGFRPGSSVAIDLFSDPVRLATVTADATGGINTAVTIPTTTSAGQHTIEASGVTPAGEALVLSATITVGGDLVRTGSSSTAPLTAAGAGLVLLGAAALVVTRRRRASRTQI